MCAGVQCAEKICYIDVGGVIVTLWWWRVCSSWWAAGAAFISVLGGWLRHGTMPVLVVGMVGKKAGAVTDVCFDSMVEWLWKKSSVQEVENVV